MLPLAMFTGNPVEWAIIAGVVVLLFGGSKLSGFGKSLGEGIKEFKKATTDDPHTPAETPAAPTVKEVPVVAGAKTEETSGR